MNMNEIEGIVRKNIQDIVEHIPKHKIVRQELQQEIIALLQIFYNQREEFIHTESVRGTNLNIGNFKELQEELLQVISEEIDESLIRIKYKMNHLKNINEDIRNHIEKFEKCTLDLDWYSGSKILDGNDNQPPLSKLLLLCLEYRTSILKYTEQIFHTFDLIDIRNRESVKKFEASIEYNDSIVGTLIAITQYIK